MQKFIVIFAIILANHLIGHSQMKTREEIDSKYQWNLQDIFISDDAWKTEKNILKGRLNELETFKGRLSESSEILADALELNSELSKSFIKLMVYAHLKSDQDTRVPSYLAMNQEIQQISIQYSGNTSFVDPEILEMDLNRLKSFINENNRLKPYEVPLMDLVRTKSHKLSEKEEKIIAEAGALASSPSSIYSIFSNSDFPFPKVTLSDGTIAELTKSGFAKYRTMPSAVDRKLVFDTFFGSIDSYKNSFAEQLYSQVKSDIFYAKVRNYPNSLNSALNKFNIPESVYYSLIENVNKNLSTFHRYLKLRKKLLGVDTLRYSDIYAPVVEKVDLDYSYEEAQKLILEALAPLGKEYTDVLGEAFTKRWIDVYPNTGKRSGAYSQGSLFGLHPYMLLNYNGKYNDASTLAHELGHAMHSYYSNQNQPYPTSRYSIFVAEVASTFNEALLMDKMLDEVKTKDDRIALMVEYLDGFKGTLFRQTQFAEFELEIHKMVEKGEALTSDALSNLYGKIIKKYYGHDLGICLVDDLYNIEWAYIPHFYYNFYVYQYATSFTASTALAEKVKNKEKDAMKNYLKFLSSGSSKYPIDLLKDAGVDMTTDAPFNQTIQLMNELMDKIEKLL